MSAGLKRWSLLTLGNFSVLLGVSWGLLHLNWLQAGAGSLIIAALLAAGATGYEAIQTHQRKQLIATLALRLRQLRHGSNYHHVLLPEHNELVALARELNKLQSHERRARRRRLMQTRTYYALIEYLGDGIVVLNHRSEVILTNNVAQEWLQMAPGEPRPMRQVITDLKLQRTLAATLADKRNRTIHLQVATKAGKKQLQVQTIYVPVSAHHWLVLAVLYDHDQMLQASRKQAELVANVSHELKTPLTAITGFSETLLAGALADEATARQFVQIISDSSKQMGELITDLLALAKLEDRTEMTLSRIELQPFFAALVKEFTPHASRHQVQLKQEVPVATVSGDEIKVRYVVRNLLQNAIRYNKEGGAVKVKVLVQQNQWVIKVIDTGCGIKAADVPHLFERFWRADDSRSRTNGGSGLGLAIVAEYVQAMSGRIKVLSQVGLGSTFIVVLPRFQLHPAGR